MKAYEFFKRHRIADCWCFRISWNLYWPNPFFAVEPNVDLNATVQDFEPTTEC
jgi:hypothetical protein